MQEQYEIACPPMTDEKGKCGIIQTGNTMAS
jgi:hypothetical protein